MKLTAVMPPWVRWVVLAMVFAAGFWTRGSLQARQEVRALKAEVHQANQGDVAVAAKLHDEARGDAARATLNHQHEEAARHDQTYRDYLDAQLPAAAVDFLRDAESIPYGPDGADPGPQAGR